LELENMIKTKHWKTIAAFGLKHKLNITQTCFDNACYHSNNNVIPCKLLYVFGICEDEFENICDGKYLKFLKDQPILYKITNDSIKLLCHDAKNKIMCIQNICHWLLDYKEQHEKQHKKCIKI